MVKTAKVNEVLETLRTCWKQRRFNYGMTGQEIMVWIKMSKIKPSDFWRNWGVNTVAYDSGTKETLYYLVDLERTVNEMFHVKHNLDWD